MQLILLLFSLFLLEETVSNRNGYLVRTKDGKNHLVLGNPKDFTEAKATRLNGTFLLNGKYQK